MIVRLREDEQVVVALQILVVRLEPLAAELRLAQRVALDHRAHRAVEDEHALGENRVELLSGRHRVACPL